MSGLRALTVEHNLSPPAEPDEAVLPSLNTAVVASFFRGETLYTFESVIQQYSRRGDGQTTIILRRPIRVVKVQRRFSYRVPVSTRTTYRLIQSDASPEDTYPANIVNISEGGMLIATNGRIHRGAVLAIGIPSDGEYGRMEVRAEVLDAVCDTSRRQESIIARLRFDGTERTMLTDDQRKQLVTYLFEQQRIMLATRRLFNPAKKLP